MTNWVNRIETAMEDCPSAEELEKEKLEKEKLESGKLDTEVSNSDNHPQD
ncbi:hypothetical protein ES703_13589 [subsurface metagenome]